MSTALRVSRDGLGSSILKQQQFGMYEWKLLEIRYVWVEGTLKMSTILPYVYIWICNRKLQQHMNGIIG